MLKHLVAMAVATTLAASLALAATEPFEASLSGHVETSDTGSKAISGKALLIKSILKQP